LGVTLSRASDAPWRLLSLGAGVQSSTLALMASAGELGPMPHAAIFADTGNEPRATYAYLDWLMEPGRLAFPVHIVRRDKTLIEALFAGEEAARIPFHVGAGGLGGRQCTRNWKLRPIRQETRRIIGASPRSFLAAETVESWVGISTDEIFRLKPSGVAYIHNRHPLVEIGMDRKGCLAWLQERGHRIPPKSSCIFCPYRRNAQWKAMKEQDPEEFAEACAIDERLRAPEQVKRFRGELFIHQSRTPLALANLDPKADAKQPDLFNNECEGICGV
jgi:hypothetical protein